MTPLNEEWNLVHCPGRHLEQVMSWRGMLVREWVEPIGSSWFVTAFHILG